MEPHIEATAYAIAGTILDEKSDNRSVMILLQAMRDTMQLASIALAIVSHEEDPESERKIFESPKTPAQILRMLADSWEEQINEEEWEVQINVFRNYEGEFKAEELTKNLPETLHVDDILNGGE